MRKGSAGFTLIELMIVIAVIGLLAAIAIPSFNEQAAKSRRSEAVSEMGRGQLAMERWRAECPTYANSATCRDPDGDGTDNRTYPTFTNTAFYTFALSGQSATAYTLTATRAGTQANDRCGNLVFTYSAGTTTKSSSTSADNCF